MKLEAVLGFRLRRAKTPSASMTAVRNNSELNNRLSKVSRV